MNCSSRYGYRLNSLSSGNIDVLKVLARYGITSCFTYACFGKQIKNAHNLSPLHFSLILRLTKGHQAYPYDKDKVANTSQAIKPYIFPPKKVPHQLAPKFIEKQVRLSKASKE